MLAVIGRLIGLAGLVAQLQGCIPAAGTVSDRLPDDFIAPAGGNGLVVGSVTSPQDPKLGWQRASVYQFRPVGGRRATGEFRSGSADDYGRLQTPFAYRNYPSGQGSRCISAICTVGSASVTSHSSGVRHTTP